ncbi:hypothetical protein ACFWZ3_16570 [Frateuria sp. GZRR35]|uniref:hypothetical protein n=1 Tax=Frateuria sp. GZRR35 TaxID=3351536 RepID=UPI003EDBB6BF
MLRRLQVIILTLFFEGVGHAACPSARHTPLLTEAEVIAIANRKAQISGVDLAKFYAPAARFEDLSKNCKWAVSYERIRPDFGNVFFVVVDDLTRAAQLQPGL